MAPWMTEPQAQMLMYNHNRMFSYSPLERGTTQLVWKTNAVLERVYYAMSI